MALILPLLPHPHLSLTECSLSTASVPVPKSAKTIPLLKTGTAWTSGLESTPQDLPLRPPTPPTSKSWTGSSEEQSLRMLGVFWAHPMLTRLLILILQKIGCKIDAWASRGIAESYPPQPLRFLPRSRAQFSMPTSTETGWPAVQTRTFS